MGLDVEGSGSCSNVKHRSVPNNMLKKSTSSSSSSGELGAKVFRMFNMFKPKK